MEKSDGSCQSWLYSLHTCVAWSGCRRLTSKQYSWPRMLEWTGLMMASSSRVRSSASAALLGDSKDSWEWDSLKLCIKRVLGKWGGTQLWSERAGGARGEGGGRPDTRLQWGRKSAGAVIFIWIFLKKKYTNMSFSFHHFLKCNSFFWDNLFCFYLVSRQHKSIIK